jgi:hypothetical protein
MEELEMATVQTSDPLPSDVPRTQVVVQQTAPAPSVREPEIRVYAHSRILYWWPVWVCGYVMTALTHFYGQPQQIGAAQELFHESSNLGVIFLLTLTLVILITNVTVRGLASVIVILSLALVALSLAYYHKWDCRSRMARQPEDSFESGGLFLVFDRHLWRVGTHSACV